MNSRLAAYSRLFHTLKYLKFKQIYYRLYYRFKSPKVKRAEIFGNQSWNWQGPSLFKQTVFTEFHVRFLNKDGEIVGSEDWNSDKLSLIHI